MMAVFFAGVAVVGNLVNVVGVVVSVLTRVRVWPPGDRDWRYWLTWACWYPATAGFVLVGVLDWGSLGTVPLPLRLGGGVLTLAGLALVFAAIRGLGVSETQGLEGELQTGGLYEYSRNPQYVGDLVMIVGWIVATDSTLTVIVGVTYAAYYLLLPLAEEPWLRQEYGEEYAAYRRDVPRFVGTTTVERLLTDRGTDGTGGRE